MTDNCSPLSITVLGTGIIGAPVASNLARKGFKVRVWNRTAAKARTLSSDGAETFDNVRDAVRDSDIVVTVLKDGPAVHEAMAAALPGLRKGVVWLQLSTVGVDAIDTLAAFAAENGIVFYDAPVQGTRQPAEQGKLIVLASGPAEERGKVQPVFDAIGQRTLWVAAQAGTSSRLKLALNAFVFALIHGTAETLAIAKALDVDPTLAMEVIGGGPLDSGYFQSRAAAIMKGDFTASFSIDNGLKDTRLVVDALAATDVRVDLAQAGLARFQRAVDGGHGAKDVAASFLA